MKKTWFKRNILSILFISAGLAVFLFVFIVFIFNKANRIRQPGLANQIPDKYYIDDNYRENNDPYITKVPRLEDALVGPIISNRDPGIGIRKAKVNIVIFSDFVCTYCHKQEQVLKKILDKYDINTRIIWKDFPESDIDSLSWQAAIAGRCAQAQGKFWPFHDELFAHDGEPNNFTFLNIADKIGLNRRQFIACLDSEEPARLVNDNIEEASALGINGIPFIYVNDQEVLGEINFDELDKLVEIELGL